MIAELYTFTLGSRVYRFVTGTVPVTIDGNEYEPAVISRQRIQVDGGDGGSATGNVQSITRVQLRKRDHDFVFDCNRTALLPDIQIDRWDGLRATMIFKGRARQPVLLRGLDAEFEVLSLYDTALTGLYQNVGWQALCNWALYDSNTCRVNKANFTITRTIARIERGGYQVVLTEEPTRDRIFRPAIPIFRIPEFELPALTPENFVGGSIRRNAGGNGRKIAGTNGGAIFLENPLIVSLEEQDANPDAQVSPGDEVTLIAGCDHSIHTCRTVFKNDPNFGGYPTIPERSPALADYGLADCVADETGPNPVTRDPRATPGGDGGQQRGDRDGIGGNIGGRDRGGFNRGGPPGTDRSG